jgi:hypothetical protein
MARKLKTKIGDIFSVPINETEKRYMQLVAYDLTQLNSDVVRVFEKKYKINASPELSSIINDKVISYAHCASDFGLKLNLWTIYGNSQDVGNPSNILFRDTDDYVRRADEEPKLKSDKWFIWRINDKDFKYVGKLKGDNRNSYIGFVINPYGIIEIVKGNKYPSNYPEYE